MVRFCCGWTPLGTVATAAEAVSANRRRKETIRACGGRKPCMSKPQEGSYQEGTRLMKLFLSFVFRDLPVSTVLPYFKRLAICVTIPFQDPGYSPAHDSKPSSEDPDLTGC